MKSEKEEKNIYRITSALPLEKYLLAASAKKTQKIEINQKKIQLLKESKNGRGDN
jgi:predicted DNA-binding ArsR family transcriptional regulator